MSIRKSVMPDYIAEVGFQDPPYTISTELYAHLQRATPERYQGMLADISPEPGSGRNAGRSAAAWRSMGIAERFPRSPSVRVV